MIISKIYTDNENLVKPDVIYNHKFETPSDDFVLCRDSNGKVTARYGEPFWDFNPYRLSAQKVPRLLFDFPLGVLSKKSKEYNELINEFKLILFKIIYYGRTGYTGVISPATIANKYRGLRKLAEYCKYENTKAFMPDLTITDILSNESYLLKYLRTHQDQKDYIRSVIGSLKGIPRNILRFDLAYTSTNELTFNKNKNSKQHPVIPPRIYAEFVNYSYETLDKLDVDLTHIEFFIAELSDRNNFTSKDRVSKKQRSELGIPYKSFIQLATEYELIDPFREYFKKDSDINRMGVVKYLTACQVQLKYIIHLFTGMRDEEVNRISYDCIEEQIIRKSIVESNVEILPANVVNIISQTTKYVGHKKQASWVAPKEVIKAVEILQRIARGIAKLNSVNVEDCYLIQASSSITGIPFENKSPKMARSHKDVLQKKDFKIDYDDLLNLHETDKARDFSTEIKFQVGEYWHFTTHQFRRSLAYYATNSGLISLPSLKRQFKHLIEEITKYYGNGFENMKTIFGYFNEEAKKFTLPKEHIAVEIQTGIPIAIAQRIVNEILGEDRFLYGKSGAYISRQKQNLDSNQIDIIEFKEETIKRAERGEISYRDTLLGGCTKVGGCDCSMLGEVTGCLTADCAIIKANNVQNQINHLKHYISQYKEDSGEYQVLRNELEQLVKYREQNIGKKL